MDRQKGKQKINGSGQVEENGEAKGSRCLGFLKYNYFEKDLSTKIMEATQG